MKSVISMINSSTPCAFDYLAIPETNVHMFIAGNRWVRVKDYPDKRYVEVSFSNGKRSVFGYADAYLNVLDIKYFLDSYVEDMMPIIHNARKVFERMFKDRGIELKFPYDAPFKYASVYNGRDVEFEVSTNDSHIVVFHCLSNRMASFDVPIDEKLNKAHFEEWVLSAL